MKLNIRVLYLYLFSLVGLVITIIGAIRLTDLGLKTFVFKNSDYYQYEDPILLSEKDPQFSTEDAKLRQQKLQEANAENNKRQKQRTASESIAMIMVGTPLYFYHWKLIKKESN
jgi:hypothetical protein